MNLYHKIISTLLAIFLIPVLSFAQNQDYLSVTGTFSNGQVSIDIVEQRVFGSASVSLYKFGTYEARLYGNKKLVSNNFFEIVESPEIWVDAKDDRPEERLVSQTSIFNVKLPLNEEIATNSIIEIWKGNRMLLRQKLSEVSLDIITALNYPIPKTDENKYDNFLVYTAITAGLIVAGWLVWRWLKMGKPQTNTGINQ